MKILLTMILIGLSATTVANTCNEINDQLNSLKLSANQHENSNFANVKLVRQLLSNIVEVDRQLVIIHSSLTFFQQSKNMHGYQQAHQRMTTLSIIRYEYASQMDKLETILGKSWMSGNEIVSTYKTTYARYKNQCNLP